ncbi:MAG: discoidin domain-containing protein, partial [Candidatus Auribacterota bacterium]|nr:discoidin domain-containing protein [Candidatus Auribacterota bacterium]
ESGSFQIKNVGILTYNFLHNHIDPVNFSNRTDPFNSVTLYSWLIFISLGGYFTFLFMKLNPRKRWIYIRIIAGTAVYMVCQTMLLTKHRVIVSNTWYYGSIFPIFFTLLCSLLLSIRIKGTKWINTSIFLAILLTSGYYSSSAWSNNPDLTYPIALRAWKKRGDQKKLLLMRDQYPHGSGWLSKELQYVDPASVKTGFWGLIEKCAYRIGARCRDDNLLARFDTLLQASSRNSSRETVYALIDNDPDTYWHISIDKIGKPAWVVADFGEGNEKVITSLVALPRKGIPWQFFESATLLGSKDKMEWYPLTQIDVESLPEDNKWQRWNFSNATAYRYYKLLITEKYFCSIAELALFEEADKLYPIH